MSIIEINGNVLNLDNLEAVSPAAQSTNKSPYVLIRSDSILDDRTYKSLRELGVHVLEYVSEDTYLCRHSGNPEKIEALPFVTHVLNYDEFFKVESGLAPAESTEGVAPSSAKESTADVRVTLHRDVELSDEIQASIERAARVTAKPKGGDKHMLQLNGIKREYLRAIAAIPVVLNIVEVLEATVATGPARRTIGRDALVALRNNNHTDLKGGGQIIAIADTGLDRTHPAFAPPGNRILGDNVPNQDHRGHGTHVSGSIAGSYANLRGVATRAQLFFQTCWNQARQQFSVDDLGQLLEAAYQAGARVHNNSWQRHGNNMRYNGGGDVVDRFVWTNRDMVVCFSAGNDGVTIGCEAGSKNGITVGATRDREAADNGNFPRYGRP
ncbi:hypothetical protein QQX98_013236 [Neonectria punicea]|uniref:Peptidase S8/S53 domain-containing protein n=1 Tax=Neonectria punicea TaxID=979145 RepID=A0ABR1GGW2_9HYPO